ncbi:TIGR02281 family clan AA aspartic protease [Pelagibius litoralis]|uniref:TIGR02281 family clan AA aspartic protease n=1 Tax=Pelagibius litoralis TaxID=374515 RepID=A0A967EZE0_9PROT|nr:TIGR02281 family clan AA aspartic protease [Pelagibius litoralis]NIA70189.1 TIGR02281 family clan AA aspartic protease [Pelagibius litoralis]
MAEYRKQRIASTGLLGQTLRLATVAIVTGIAVAVLMDRYGAPADPDAPLIRDVTPALIGPGAAYAGTDPGQAGPGPAGGSDIVLKAGAHGHFMVDATVNGEVLRFLIDTGASSIFLTAQDAEKLGWSPNRLTFSERYETVNGEIRAAPIELRSLRIGQMELYDLPASVGEGPGSVSLLGMTFLKQFESYQVRGDTLLLTW